MNISPRYLFDDSAVKEILQLLSSSKRICILTHVNPDGDAIGSSLALGNLLSKLKHEVSVITPNPMMGFLKWMDGAEKIISFANQKELGKEKIETAEIIFCLDFNNLSRIKGPSEFLFKNKLAKKILIDHHIHPDGFCKFNFSFPEACATAELIFYFIQSMGLTDLIDIGIAECLYCGIMTDSGNFRFESVSPELHEITAELLKKGVNQNKVYELVYDSNSINTLKLHGYVMSEKLEYIEECGTAIISLNNEEQQRFKVGKTEIDDVVNFGLKIKGVRLSAFFYDNEGQVKVSFRSKGAFSAKDIATKYYAGGGHLNAAGGVSSKDISDTVAEFKRIINEIHFS